MTSFLNQNVSQWHHSLCAFCERTGCVFANFSLLEKALTHASWANEQEESENNERLEFLGDAVLEHAISLHLYRTFPEDDEGQLTKRRRALVCEKSLAQLGRSLGLHQLLRVGASLQGQVTDAMVADAFEALVAALFLDGGDASLSCVLTSLVTSPTEYHDAKTTFIERCRAQSLTWCFEKLRKEGPDHLPCFTVNLLVGSQVFTGRGPTRKGAEQMACSVALQWMEDKSIDAIGCAKDGALV